MKKVVFILIIENDLSDMAGLIGRIKALSATRNLYKVSNSLHFIETLKAVEEAADSVFQPEVRVIIDLDLPFFEAYVCLVALAAYDYKCPVRVYLLEDEHTVKPSPSISQYTIAGHFHKPIKQDDIAHILSDHYTGYFQKGAGNLSDVRFDNIFER